MNIDEPLALLGGLTPQTFMRRHWQKKPLLVRQAWPSVRPPVTRAQAFVLAASPDVESRLVVHQEGRWSLRHGPLPRRALPAVGQPGWTLLLQGLDMAVPAAHQMLQAFRFVPDARLDDLMLSWASPGGGVGPHTDEYDVFLLQVQGSRRWRVGPVKRATWVADTPLKRLAHFAPTHNWLLEPGDMLYLPPGWGHDGVAEGGECMTCSIGFRAPAAQELATQVLQRWMDEDDDAAPSVNSKKRYQDRSQPATPQPAALPPALLAFAHQAVQTQFKRWLADPQALARVVGEWASEPKAQVCFTPGAALCAGQAVHLSPRTRMLYDEQHIFINGEALRASGRDAQLMRLLADSRTLSATHIQRLSAAAHNLLSQWVQDGWALMAAK
jgi:50S ribosomal protein L16 3-hydroxylase